MLNALAALKERVQARASALPPPPHYGGRPLTALLTIAAAHGGQKGSALPGRFDILLNRRYAPEENFDDARAEIEAVVRTPRGTLGVETEYWAIFRPSRSDRPHWPRWQEALSAGFGWAPENSGPGAPPPPPISAGCSRPASRRSARRAWPKPDNECTPPTNTPPRTTSSRWHDRAGLSGTRLDSPRPFKLRSQYKDLPMTRLHLDRPSSLPAPPSVVRPPSPGARTPRRAARCAYRWTRRPASSTRC